MGTDIYSKSAMILDEPQKLLERLNSQNQRAIKEAIANRIKRCIKRDKKRGIKDGWYEQSAERLQSKYKDSWLDTSRVTTVENMKEELMDMLEVNGEPGKYADDIHMPRVDEADLFWGAVIETLYPDFPEFLGFDVWGSSRFNGDEVPLGIPCAKFCDEDCFVRVMTSKGKAFAKVTGIETPTNWTEISS